MGAIQDIMTQVDVNQLAGILGTDPQTAQAAAEQAVGSLVSNMENTAGDEPQARQFANALGQHMNSPVFDGNGINLDAVDVNDGAKIVNHVIPAGQQQALFGGAQGSLIQRLMPLLAPIVMAYLAKRLQSQGGLGSILGGVLGGGMGGMGGGMGGLGGGFGQQQAYPQSGGGLDDIFGQILGGGQSRYAPQQQMPAGQGGLGDILGQVLGGGQQSYGDPAQQGYSQPMQQEPTYQQPPSSGDLRMDDPGVAPTYQQPQQGQPGVGDVLKNILFGR